MKDRLLRARADYARAAGNRIHSGGLAAYEARIASQNGEDGVILEILERVGTAGTGFVEFGIETGTEGNCVALADMLNWSGVFWEADPTAFEHLAAKYASCLRIRTGCETVTPNNINDLFRAYAVHRDLDVLSIDIDGDDYWVWKALEVAHPRVVVIEYNGSIDPESRLVQPMGEKWCHTDFFGASAGAIRALGESKGYRLVHTDMTGVNAFLVRQDLPWNDRKPPTLHKADYYFSGNSHPRDETGRKYLEVA